LPIWVIGTYLFELFSAYPYIELWGLKGSGKSKVMTLSSILSFNGEMFVNMSAASVFRIIEHDSPTLCIDEAENLWADNQKGNDDTSDIVAMLNAGWMKGANIPRVEKVDGEMKIGRFNVYCPKMLGSIKGMKGALESRCIKIVMVKPLNKSEGDSWPKKEDKDLLALRDEVYPFILKHWKDIDRLYSWDEQLGGLKKEFKISNRDWQMWQPLLCIAKLISDELYQKVGRWAEEEIERVKADEHNEDSWDYKIYEAMQEWVTSEEVNSYYVSDLKALIDKHFIERIYISATGAETPIYQKDRPSSSYVGRVLNKIGLRHFKRRGKKNYYRLSRKIVNDLLLKVNAIQEEEPKAQHKLQTEEVKDDPIPLSL